MEFGGEVALISNGGGGRSFIGHLYVLGVE
jgi:hypothetical protein